MPKSNNQEEREVSSIMDGRVLVAAHSYVGATMVFTQWSLEPNHLRRLTCWQVVSKRSSYCRDWHPNSTTYSKPCQQIKTCICRNALTSHHKFLCKRKVVTCYQAWELTKLTSYPFF
ncbi:unnamed protein product, partial [Sphagnum jensenii]